MNDEAFMRRALELARRAEQEDEVPIGAIVVLDPDGNNVEAVYHGPAKRSAGSVKISFTG